MFIIILMKIYIVFLLCLMFIYMIRHITFSFNRINKNQDGHFNDIIDSMLPFLSVVIPMHNEEKVVRNIMDLLTETSYPKDKLEIIPVNDHSVDKTGEIIDEYASKFSFIRPLHRQTGTRGKPSALNDALNIANGEIIAVFDADYLPPKGILRDMVISFKDPEIGATMGRVIPENAHQNLLTKILSLERAAGYQIDQQARQNLGLIPQYGGTVGAFKKDLVISLGGFSSDILTEDTELTFKLIINGWKVQYNNRIECYEEVPEDWNVRKRQLRRWARGHTQVMFRYILPLIKSPYLSLKTKYDGILLLNIYLVPIFIMIGIADTIALFFLNEVQLLSNFFLFLSVAGFNMFGNFAPFYQIGTAAIIDGSTYRIRLLPFVMFNFLFNMLYSARGAFDAILDRFIKRKIIWQKTERFR